MPDQFTSDYIAKTEAAAVYRRSERSLSRDITTAMKFRDATILASVELQLEDGTRRPGSELTIEEIVELRDRGLNPTWLIHRRWLQATYGRRDEPPPAGSSSSPSVPPLSETNAAPATQLPEELPQRVAVLAAQNEALRQTNADLREQAARLEKELDRRAEERREENELQKQNNVLMQQVYNLLSRMSEAPGPISILPAPQASTPKDRAKATDHVESISPSNASETQPVQNPAKKIKRQAPQRKTAQPKQPKAGAKAKRKPAVADTRKLFPTFDRAVRSFFRK